MPRRLRIEEIKARAADPAHWAKLRWQTNSLMRHYGMKLGEYEDKLAAQGGVCRVCGASESTNARSKRLQVDHDHSTGQTRDLLCSCCNSALGMVGDSIERLQALITYLTRWKQT